MYVDIRACVHFVCDVGEGNLFWDNKRNPSLSFKHNGKDLIFNSGKVVSSVELVFYSDLSVGAKQKIILYSSTSKVELQFQKNVTAFYYDDWLSDWKAEVKKN